MIVEIGITVFMSVAVFLMAILGGDLLRFVMFVTMAVVATVAQMILVEMDGGQILMSHMTNYIMWGTTLSFVVILIRTLKGTQ